MDVEKPSTVEIMFSDIFIKYISRVATLLVIDAILTTRVETVPIL